MSFDLNLATVCNHNVFRELAVMDSDRRTLRMQKPLSSSVGVQVYASDNLIPKTMYSIIYDPSSTASNQARMVSFKDKWPSPTDYFEITYITLSTYCSKCVNLKVIDDISYDVRGQMATNRNENLLLQNLEKWTVTQINSNPFHSFIGSGLIQLIGQRVLDVDFLSARISQEITSSLGRFQDMQGQYRLTGRPMSEGETLETVENIQVKFDDNDQTILRVDVTVTARSGQPLQFTQFLRLRTA
jgi:hypothetical protein